MPYATCHPDRELHSKGLCQKCYDKEYHKANKEKYSAVAKAYRLANKEKMRAYGRAYYLVNKEERKVYLQANKEKRKAGDRNSRFKRTYNITIEQYDKMLLKQKGSCLTCNVHESKLKYKLSVDHDHSCCPGMKSCGKCIRGLLCSKCNHALGQVNDKILVLENLISYLKKFSLKG